jgi:hypothetical protein
MCTKQKEHDIISEKEYQEILNDNLSSTEQIKKRINYLEVFLRNIIKKEIKNCIKSDTY